MTEAIDRATSEDMVSLATDVGSAPMQVGAVLVLAAEVDPQRAIATIGERIRTVPRLRRRLVHTPFGCGRPVWVDDADFDIHRHMSWIVCPVPGGDDALLATASEAVRARLPNGQPLWRMVLVSGLEYDRSALIVVFHHVLADGIGGLAVLANLVDGVNGGHAAGFPRPAPSNRVLARDAIRSRLTGLGDLPGSLRRLRAAFGQLRRGRGVHAMRSSLNRPTGARRQFKIVQVALEDVRRAAHAHAATVNDVVLTAVAAALHELLRTRGESVDRFVASVPVSARQQASVAELGNQVGVIPVELPATGDAQARIATIAETTRAAKRTPPAASTALLGPIFRVLARAGLFQWFIDRQRLVHTFVTNVRGPDARLEFLGTAITDVVPLAVVTGNVTVSFAVLSYAGTVGITIIADPDACPDLDTLRDALRHEMDQLLRRDDGNEGRGGALTGSSR